MLTPEQIAAIESNGHSLFGGSKWHRLLRCTASLLAEVGLPDTAGVEAAEGTLAHSIAAQMLEYGLLPADFSDDLGRVYPINGFDITLTPSMLHHVEQYVIWCHDAEVEDCLVIVEQRIDYSFLTPIPRQGGSADHAILAPGLLILTDLKYGEGVQVFAERNYQLFAYALGLYHEWDFIFSFERIVFRIAQPRLDHFDVWETTADELLYFADFAKRQMFEAWSPHAKYTPSEEACKFCKAAKGHCSAAITLMDKVADDTFVDLTQTPKEVDERLGRMGATGYYIVTRTPKTMSSLELSNVLGLSSAINEIMAAAFTELSRRVFLGEKVEGWGIIKGRASRELTDPDGAASELEFMGLSPDAVYERKLASPAKVEELLVGAGLKKKDAVLLMQPYVTKTDGQPHLARLKKGKKNIVEPDDDVFDDVRENL